MNITISDADITRFATALGWAATNAETAKEFMIAWITTTVTETIARSEANLASQVAYQETLDNTTIDISIE